MRLKLFLMFAASCALGAMAQTAVVTGSVVDADTGAPIPGAVITIPDQGISVTAGPAGDFRISNARPGEVVLNILAAGFADGGKQVRLFNGQDINAGAIGLMTDDGFYAYNEENTQDQLFDETMLEDEEGNQQSITALAGASDDIYYKFTRYGYSPLYSNYRGYGSAFQETYINGLPMNDLIRGGFTFSQLGGMTSRAFRNSTATVGISPAAYGFGAIGGSQNFNTLTSAYAPGFNGSLSYTNSNYKYRAMATYSTGMMDNGYAVTISAIGRYADEGIVPGTFYNAGGLFLSVEKMLNTHNSLFLTFWGAPMQYANGRAAVQEVYDLTGDNLYNPSWGWQSGKKRSDNIREKFDPTVMLNWLYRSERTTLNTGLAFRWVNFARTRVNYYKGNDPKPDYYKNLPSYWADNRDMPVAAEYYTDLWQSNSTGIRQMDWDMFYNVNRLNNLQNQDLPEDQQLGSTYIQQKEHSNQFNLIFNTVLNQRLTDAMSLQAGLSFNFTRSTEYMTVKDLMGGQFWVDVDPFSDRELTNPSAAPGLLQNDLDHPDRRVVQGDVFGYHYGIYALKGKGWLQNQINLPKWDINYGFELSYEQFYRQGYMRNGRAPLNSLGESKTLRFTDAAFKAGATYKLDGRNFFTVRAQYGTAAPLIKDIYIAPRIKDTTVGDPQSQRIFSADFTYRWNYRRFRGSLSAFFTDMSNGLERNGFYDETYNTYCNFAISGVHRQYKGIELGMAYKITPSITATFAGTYSRFQYKNNPMGTRSIENGLYPDVTSRVYLKNYFCTSTPQTAFNIGLDYAAPKNWFFNVNASWLADYYVQLAFPRHEVISGLASASGIESEEDLKERLDGFTNQDKMKNNWVLNASIGKAIYLNRKVSLNFNVSVSNIINNKNLITNAYQQSRIDTKNYNPNAYPTRYQYAQGIKVFVNAGIRF